MQSGARTNRHQPRKQKGERKNIYFTNRALQRLNRLTLEQGEQGFSATIEEALALLDRERTDYVRHIRDAVLSLAALPGMDERERAILKLASLLNNDLAARAIAQAVVEVVVLGPTTADQSEQSQKETEA